MAPPFDPLPFDGRSECFCARGCPGSTRPEARYWCNIAGADPLEPRLEAGVVLVVESFTVSLDFCRWINDPLFLNFILQSFSKINNVGDDPFKYSLVVQFKNLSSTINYAAELNFTNLPCTSTWILSKFQGPAAWGDTKLTPIPWFKDANDVPHSPP